MLQKVTLTLAARQLINIAIMNDVPKVDTTVARIVRTIRTRLDLREARRTVDQMIQAKPEQSVSWEALQGMTDFTKSYTLDDAHLHWLQERLQAKDWNTGAGPDGQSVPVRIPAEMIDVIADLADALVDATPVNVT